ncbi:hypothetical protein C9994_09345 [Marivirga lumbricoides]|uniref:Phosphatidic acid phosphatase type 2/haloperoxidase domain-containing protein n=1 Tax=Marivirga lumbricoides TaxID=1046115 RepID=A0A2T4DQ82_9BACT|nr:hypothetical protein C9994_09345 [Marivirga lumbricoides]
MISLIKRHYFCLSIYLSLITICTLLTQYFGKKATHLEINKYNCSFFDFILKYVTHLGDGIFAIVIIVVMLFNRFRYAVMLLYAFLISGITSQVLKKIFFKDVERPALYFKNISELRFVEGVELMYSNSFPSGHSATAFALAFSLIFITKKISHRYILFGIALVVSFSRVYLSEHFLEDVMAGSLIGVIAAFISYLIVHKSQNKFLDNQLRISLYNTEEKKLNESN